MFGAIDWFVLAVYWCLSIFIGLYAARSNRSFKDYMLGGSSMPWIPVGISLIATSVSATTLLGVPADVFDVDMTFIMTNVGSFLSILVVGLLFIPRLRKSGAQSAYEVLEKSFSRSVRRIAAVFYAMHLVLRTGILLFAPSLVLAPILQIPVWAAILISSVAAIIYTWYGGFKAVVWTDVMQFAVFLGGGIFALFVLVNGIGGFGELATLANESGKSHWFNASLDISNARTLLSAGIVYAVLEIAIRGCDQQFVQRYLSCKDVKAANRSSILSMVLGLVVSLLFYWLGAALFVYYKIKHVNPLPENLGVNDVFPYFIVNSLPSGLTGLLVAAIYAAAMSSISSAIHALGNTTEKDILCKPSGQESMFRTKLWIVLWGVCGTFAAFIAASQAGSLLKNALFFTGLFTGPLLALFLLSFFATYLRSFSVVCGVVCGMLSLFLFNSIPFSVPFIPQYTPPLDGVFSWPWNPLISCTVSIWLALCIDFVIPRKVVNEVA